MKQHKVPNTAKTDFKKLEHNYSKKLDFIQQKLFKPLFTPQ